MASVKIFNHHFRTPFLILLVSEYFLLFYFCYLGVYFRFGVFEWQPDLISLEEFPLKASVYSVVMLLGMFAMGQYESPGLKGRHYFPVIAGGDRFAGQRRRGPRSVSGPGDDRLARDRLAACLGGSRLHTAVPPDRPGAAHAIRTPRCVAAGPSAR